MAAVLEKYTCISNSTKESNLVHGVFCSPSIIISEGATRRRLRRFNILVCQFNWFRVNCHFYKRKYTSLWFLSRTKDSIIEFESSLVERLECLCPNYITEMFTVRLDILIQTTLLFTTFLGEYEQGDFIFIYILILLRTLL